MERRNIRRDGRRPPDENGAEPQHRNLPDLVRDAAYHGLPGQEQPDENPAPNPDEQAEVPLQEERHDQNDDQLVYSGQMDADQNPVPDQRPQDPGRQIPPQGAVMNLAVAGIAAGSAAWLHQDRLAPEAHFHGVQHRHGHICRHRARFNVGRVENIADNSGRLHNLRQQLVHQSNPPVVQHRERQSLTLPRFFSAAVSAAAAIPLTAREISKLKLLHPIRDWFRSEDIPAPSWVTGTQRRPQPQPSTSQQAALSSRQCVPMRYQLRCKFCPIPATNQRVDYSNLPHELSNFDAITVDNLAINFCRRLLAICPPARWYVRTIQSVPPNHLPHLEPLDDERDLQTMYHGPFCPVELIRNWPDPPFTPPVRHPSSLPENLRGWDPVSIKKAKKLYCKEVLKHNPCVLEDLTGMRSISPDRSSTSADSSAMTDPVHHRDASCPLILFDKCLPCDSDSPQNLGTRSPTHFKRATPRGRRKGSVGTQTDYPCPPKPEDIAGPSQPTNPSPQNCNLCASASTRPADSGVRYTRHTGRCVMWGLCRELLRYAFTDPERVTIVSPDRLSSSESIAYRSVIGQTIQHNPLCVVPTLGRCPYCREPQQSASSQRSERPSISRSSDTDTYVRITCDHYHGCPIGILGYCPECRVEPARSHPHRAFFERQVEAVEVEEQLQQRRTTQSGLYFTPSEPPVEAVEVEQHRQNRRTSKSGLYYPPSEPQVEAVEVEKQLQERRTSKSGLYSTLSEPQVEAVEVEEQLQGSETLQGGPYPTPSEPEVEAVEAEEQLQDSEASQSGSYPTSSKPQATAAEIEEKLQDSETSQSSTYPKSSDSFEYGYAGKHHRESETSQSTSSTDPTTQDDQFSLKIVHQYPADDNDDDDDDDVSTWL